MPDEDASTQEKRPVILDANALMMQFQYYLDLETELQRVIPGAYNIHVPQAIVDELEVLAEKNEGKTAEEARLSIELAKTFHVVESDAKDGDTAVIQLAEDLEGAVVVTNDKLLRARLRAKGIPNVHMRSKAFLSVEGFPGF
ncbi:MAG: twitching motility protein PilT [Candidatus Thermoplasmatota archaeon]|nr:twitching motility protein PilT [Candidatus Thermoplasmatota archaeon]